MNLEPSRPSLRGAVEEKDGRRRVDDNHHTAALPAPMAPSRWCGGVRAWVSAVMERAEPSMACVRLSRRQRAQRVGGDGSTRREAAETRAERRPRADGADLRWKDVRGGAAAVGRDEGRRSQRAERTCDRRTCVGSCSGWSRGGRIERGRQADGGITIPFSCRDLVPDLSAFTIFPARVTCI